MLVAAIRSTCDRSDSRFDDVVDLHILGGSATPVQVSDGVFMVVSPRKYRHKVRQKLRHRLDWEVDSGRGNLERNWRSPVNSKLRKIDSQVLLKPHSH